MIIKKQTKKYTFRHFIIVDGAKKEINPLESDIADKCNLAIAYMVTGKEHVLVGDSN